MNFNDPIENRLGLDRPDREDDARDGVPEWRKLTFAPFHEVLELARRKMAEVELARLNTLRDLMINKPRSEE